MARSGQPLGHSGKLPNDVIFQLDNDDLMARIWELTKEKEKVQEELDKTTMEIDGWLQILNCSSAQELQQLIDDFPSTPSILPSSFTVLHSSAERECLEEYCSVLTQLSVHELLDCTSAYKTEEGELLIKFPSRPPNRPDDDFLILLTPGPDNTYSVSCHNLPPTVPLDNLVTEYLQKPQGLDGVRKFVAVMGQYSKAFYSRVQQNLALEASGLLGGTFVHYTRGATNLNFIMDPELEDHPSLLVEFILKFHPLDILPHTVKVTAFSMSGKAQIPAWLREMLEEVGKKMKTSTFPQVLLEYSQRRRAAQPSPSTSSAESTQQETPTPTPPTSSVASGSEPSGGLFYKGK